MASDLSDPPMNDSAPPQWTAENLDIADWSDLEPGRPGPADAVDRDQGYWTTTDHQRIYWQAWLGKKDQGPRRATVALMHGYGEHSARYDHVAIALVRAGYDVMAIDARGHGRSTGRRGHVTRFRRYVDDLAMLKRRALDRFPDRPLFVLGHSNGGLISLRYALRKPNGVSGFVVTSPLCQLAMRVSPAKKVLSQLTSRLAPTLSLPSGLKAEMVSQTPAVIDHYSSDPLIFPTANTRWFAEMHQAATDLSRRAQELTQPFLFMVAGDDRIVDPGATEAIFHDLGSLDRELEVFPELYHEVLNEQPWRTILSRIVVWMERHRLPNS